MGRTGLSRVLGSVQGAGQQVLEVREGAPHGYTMADTSSWNEQAFLRAFANLKDLLARSLH